MDYGIFNAVLRIKEKVQIMVLKVLDLLVFPQKMRVAVCFQSLVKMG